MRRSVERPSGRRLRSSIDWSRPCGAGRASARAALRSAPSRGRHRSPAAQSCALQQRAHLADVGEGNDPRRDAVLDLGLSDGEGLAQLAQRTPPISAASSRPSGLSARRTWMSVPGRSLTNCRASADTTRSSEPSPNGSASSSAATARQVRRAFLPGKRECGVGGDDGSRLAAGGKRAAHGIGRRAEIDRAVELPQHRRQPIGQTRPRARSGTSVVPAPLRASAADAKGHGRR